MQNGRGMRPGLRSHHNTWAGRLALGGYEGSCSSREHTTGALSAYEYDRNGRQFEGRSKMNDESCSTRWHELSKGGLYDKLGELNRRLSEHGFRTRFRVTIDEYGWDVIVDDGGDLELVKTVQEAEDIVEELCGSG